MTSSGVTSDGDSDLAVIVGLSVAGGVLLLVALVLLAVLVCRACRRRSMRMRDAQSQDVANFAWHQDAGDNDTVHITDLTRRPGLSQSLSLSLSLSVCLSVSLPFACLTGKG